MKICRNKEHGISLSDTSKHSVKMVYKMSNKTVFAAIAKQTMTHYLYIFSVLHQHIFVSLNYVIIAPLGCYSELLIFSPSREGCN